ncbi:MAG: acetyltransferase, partial [Anaerolineae bacterium]|nr:acetyltransferase [Anaerolineae bacterium]
SGGDIPAGLRITDAALALAREHGLDLSSLPSGPLLTEKAVRTLLPGAAVIQGAADPNAMLVYGGSGHGKSLIDLIRALDSYNILGIVDDGLVPGEMVMDLPVLGGAGQLQGLYAQGVHLAVNAIGGIGNIMSRVAVFDKLAAAGYTCPSLVHPTAFVEASAILSQGAQVFPHAYVGSDAQVGFGVIVNTGAIVSHDCTLGDYANIAPGSMLAGGVHIGEATLIGMGVTINLNVKIGKHARIGNSAVIKEDVPENGVVRAGTSWPG